MQRVQKKKKRHVEAEHVVGGPSKTGLEMFSIGCGAALPVLTWVNKYRLMSSSLVSHPLQIKPRQKPTGAAHVCSRQPASQLPSPLPPLRLHYEI